jgi:geranylgeranyl pyrophosphate synthase
MPRLWLAFKTLCTPRRGVDHTLANARCRVYTWSAKFHPTSQSLYTQLTTETSEYAASLAAGFNDVLHGFLDGVTTHRPLLEFAVQTGHRTRPVGCLLACAAVGGDWTDALDVAVGVELIHKASVIRDDIVDGDSMRSGQPAFHVAHGVARAIAASDLLWTLGLRCVSAGTPSEVSDECVRATTSVLWEMAAGQLEDVSPSDTRRGSSDRLAVEEQKTGSLSGLACRLGAIVGGGVAFEVEALTCYGRKIGTAFQVLNDVRNLNGEEKARQPASDVRNRRDTVLSARMREVADPEIRRQLDASGAQDDDMTTSQVATVRGALLKSGAVEFGETLAAQLLLEAADELSGFPPTLALTILESLTSGALRDYAF